MNRTPKKHVQWGLIRPLEEFHRDVIDRMRAFNRYVSSMSPVDGVAPLGFLTKTSRDMRDAASEFAATVDAHAARVHWMKAENRKRRKREVEARKQAASDARRIH